MRRTSVLAYSRVWPLAPCARRGGSTYQLQVITSCYVTLAPLPSFGAATSRYRNKGGATRAAGTMRFPRSQGATRPVGLSPGIRLAVVSRSSSLRVAPLLAAIATLMITAVSAAGSPTHRPARQLHDSGSRACADIGQQSDTGIYHIRVSNFSCRTAHWILRRWEHDASAPDVGPI